MTHQQGGPHHHPSPSRGELAEPAHQFLQAHGAVAVRVEQHEQVQGKLLRTSHTAAQDDMHAMLHQVLHGRTQPCSLRALR